MMMAQWLREYQREQRRSQIMNRIRILLLAAFAMFALSAITSTAAQAASEGPFYRICEPQTGGFWEDNECSKTGAKKAFEKIRLLAGQTRNIELEMHSEEYVLANGVQTLKCKKQKAESGTIIGSTGANAGTSEEVILFEECTVEGNGAGCEVENKTIKTEPVKNTLDWSKEVPAKGDVHLIMFQPVAGAVFTKLKFVGVGCTLKTATVEGKVGAQLDNGKKELLKLEENEELAELGLVTFPATLITTEWVEKEGKHEKVSMSLKSFGKAATKFEGKTRIKLVGGAHWGVFSH
jgi:hypothetical protein